MMEFMIGDIEWRSHDFKVCRKCRAINWYENEACCNVDCTSTLFNDDSDAVEDRIREEYDFYKEEGMTEDQIDNIFLET